jgi:hypothetical protein
MRARQIACDRYDRVFSELCRHLQNLSSKLFLDHPRAVISTERHRHSVNHHDSDIVEPLSLVSHYIRLSGVWHRHNGFPEGASFRKLAHNAAFVTAQ